MEHSNMRDSHISSHVRHIARSGTTEHVFSTNIVVIVFPLSSRTSDVHHKTARQCNIHGDKNEVPFATFESYGIENEFDQYTLFYTLNEKI